MMYTRRLALVDSFPTDAEGNPLSGFVQVGTHSDGRIYLDCADEAPEGAEVVATGLARFADIVGTEYADYALEATYTELLDDEEVRSRDTITDVPLGATIIATDLPPHTWLGD